MKGGKALEALSRVRSLVIDKTGTLTHGRARVVEIRPAAGMTGDEILRLAASLDQASPHVIARALVGEARERGFGLTTPDRVEETPGEGVRNRRRPSRGRRREPLRPSVIGPRRALYRAVPTARAPWPCSWLSKGDSRES